MDQRLSRWKGWDRELPYRLEEGAAPLRLLLRSGFLQLLAHSEVHLRAHRGFLAARQASVTTEPWSVTTHTDESLGLLRTGWRRHPFYYDEISEPAALFEYQVEPHMLRHRRNELRIGLAGVAHPVVLRDVELDVRFSPTAAG